MALSQQGVSFGAPSVGNGGRCGGDWKVGCFVDWQVWSIRISHIFVKPKDVGSLDLAVDHNLEPQQHL